LLLLLLLWHDGICVGAFFAWHGLEDFGVVVVVVRVVAALASVLADAGKRVLARTLSFLLAVISIDRNRYHIYGFRIDKNDS